MTVRRNEIRNEIDLQISDKKVIRLVESGFYSKNNIAGIIRFHISEFESIDNLQRDMLTHFNLQKADHEIGSKYALIEILEPGHFDSDGEKLPILNPYGVYIAECTSIEEEVAYSNLSSGIFENSLPHIKDIDSLKKAILERYQKSMPELSDAEILKLGIAITKLNILEKRDLILDY